MHTQQHTQTHTVLVTGASGYVGGRLASRAVAQGWNVRVLVRNKNKIKDASWAEAVHIFEGDSLNPDHINFALEGVNTAYYLMHSLQHGDKLESTEAEMATLFARTARQNNVNRIVYLGGLAPNVHHTQASAHMRSRANVGRILRESGVPTTELRAGVIIGPGSTSFEMLRYLTERLPAMITPRWVRQRCQPIDINDVLEYLIHSANMPSHINRAFDIGGPDQVTYQDMMHAYARAAGLPKRVILPVNVLTPKLSSHWVGVVTPVPAKVAKPLVHSLRHDAVCKDNDIFMYCPVTPTTFEEALTNALTGNQDAHRTQPYDASWAGGAVFTDTRRVSTHASPEYVHAALQHFGSTDNSYPAKPLWRARAWADRAVGGIGMGTPRQGNGPVQPGETIDFWEVEHSGESNLTLKAKWRMPGQAWLVFNIAREGEITILTQVAKFIPKGLAGHAYWAAVAPFHKYVFPAMAEHIVREAEDTQLADLTRPGEESRQSTHTTHPKATTPHPKASTPHPKASTPHPESSTPHPESSTPHQDTPGTGERERGTVYRIPPDEVWRVWE